MERDPHQLIEGIVLTCYAVGAAQAFLYVRGEMALAQERVAQALNEAYAAGYVGKNILGTDFSVDIMLTWGAGAYIVGRGDRAHREPRGQPGHAPAQAAVLPGGQGPLPAADDRQQRRDAVEPARGSSTNGGDAFKRHRRRDVAPGMRMFAVSGHVNRPGVFEVPQRRHHVPRPHRRARVLRRDPRRPRAQGVHPRRRVGAVVLRGAPRPARSRSPPSTRPARCSASGAIVVMDETTDMVKACLAHRALLRPRVAAASARRAARARPGSSASCAASSTATAARATSTCCSTCATTSAPASLWPPRQTTICPLGPSAVVADRVGAHAASATSSRPTSTTAVPSTASTSRARSLHV